MGGDKLAQYVEHDVVGKLVQLASYAAKPVKRG